MSVFGVDGAMLCFSGH